MRAIQQPAGLYSASVLVFVCLSLMAADVRAQSTRFGTEGQTMPFGWVGVELEFGSGAPATGDAVGHNFSLQLSPSVLRFFARNFAWGVGIDFRYSDYTLQAWPYTDLEFGVSGAFGVHLPFNEIAGFFPQLWLGGGYLRREYMPMGEFDRDFLDPSAEAEASKDAWVTEGPYLSTQLLLSFVFQVARATLISLGPSARLHFAIDKGERTVEFGLNVGVGRYF